MTLDEFHEVYNQIGEVGASLVVGEVDCDLDEFFASYPRLSYLWRPQVSTTLSLGGFWWAVVRSDPDSIKYCPTECLEGFHWSNLVRNHQELIKYCKWDKLTEGNWTSLLGHRPELACYRVAKEEQNDIR